jgi:hypothetical protein
MRLMTFTNLIIILCCFVVMSYSIKIIVNSYNPKAAVYVNMYSIYYIFLLSTLLFASACNSYIETMSAGSSSGVPSTKSPDGVTVQPNSLLNFAAQKQSAHLASEDEQKLKNDEAAAAQAKTLTTPVSPNPDLSSGSLNLGQPNPGQPSTVPPISVQPISVQPDSVQPDSVSPGSVPPGSVPPGSVPPGSVPPDSVQPDSLQPISGQPGSESLNHDLSSNSSSIKAHAKVEAATTEAQAAARPSQSTEVEAAIAMQKKVENASEKVKNAKKVLDDNHDETNKKALKSAENDLTNIILDHMLKEVSKTDDQSQTEPTEAEKQLESAIKNMKEANEESNIDELQEQLNAAVDLVYNKRKEAVIERTETVNNAKQQQMTPEYQVNLAEAKEKEAEAKLKEAQMARAQAILVLQFAQVAHHNSKPNSEEYLEEAKRKDKETGAAVREAIKHLENARAVTLAAKENLKPKSETVEPVKVPQENVEELEAKVEELKAKVEVLKAKVETTRGSIPDNTSNPEYDSNLNNYTQALEELKKAKEELEKAEKELTLPKAIKEQNELKPQEQESTPEDDFKETFEKAFEHATAANKKKEETQQNLSNAQRELSEVRETIKYDSNEQTIQLYDNKSDKLNIAFEAAKKAGQESYTAFKTLNELIQKYDKQPKYKQSEEEQSKNRELHDKAGDILNKLDELNKQSTTLYENINTENMGLGEYIGRDDDDSKQKFKKTIEKIKFLNTKFTEIQTNINELEAELSNLFLSENNFKQQ